MKHFLFILTILFSCQILAQEQRQITIKPEQTWYLGSEKKTSLTDSCNFFRIIGDSIEFRIVYKNNHWYEKGKIIRWTDSIINQQEFVKFYITKRGGLKGSLTVEMKKIDSKNYQIHCVSPFGNIDRFIFGEINPQLPIYRPIKKKYKPS